MRKMRTDQFYDVLTIWLTQLSKTVDLKDPETIVYTEEFDDLLRHIQSRPLGKLRTVYVQETAENKLLYRQLLKLLEEKESIRIT